MAISLVSDPRQSDHRGMAIRRGIHGDIGGAAADVDQTNAQIALVVSQTAVADASG